jgi:hypothetical protein
MAESAVDRDRAGSALIRVAISPGELLDKITILELKSERMTDAAGLANVARELAVLRDDARRSLPSDAVLERLSARLKEINARLWDLEDDIRDCERRKDFGARFIECARGIYRTNDERAAVKKDVNRHLGSLLVEEKSYAAY